MKSILELINEIKSQNLTNDEILEKYNEMINIEKFYLGIINSERNSREEIEKERNLALVDEDFRNNYSQHCKYKNMQKERNALKNMNKEELKSFISTIRTAGNFDTSRLTDSEKTRKVEERLNQRISEYEQQQNSAVHEFLIKKDGSIKSKEEYEKLSDEEKIEKLYNLYLAYYGKTGYHPHPANLLALKLLLKRNEFKGLKVNEGMFYNEYKESIDKSIQEVEKNFNIDEEEIKSYIERKGLLVRDDNYYHDKIWHVYAEGFGVLHGNFMYTPEKNSLAIYSDLNNKNIVFAPYGENEEKPDISIYDDEYKDTRLKTNRVNYKKLIKSMQSR